jgi:hypothetical protein
MVFKFLSKPKATIEIISHNKVLPGTLLPVEIRITAQEEIKARELRVELVGEENYYVKETHRDSKGHTSTRVVQKTGTIDTITKTIAEQPIFNNGSTQQWKMSLQLPAKAPPTCRTKLINIQWKLKAVLDLPKQPDQSQEIPLCVLCTFPQADNQTVLPDEKYFNDVAVNMVVPHVASPGETLVGRLTLQMKDSLNVQGIRVELVQIEDAGARQADEVISKMEVAGSTTFNQGEVQSFDFFLNVPAEAPPTAVSLHSGLRWKVKAVIARRMKTDFNVEREVLVCNAPGSKNK